MDEADRAIKVIPAVPGGKYLAAPSPAHDWLRHGLMTMPPLPTEGLMMSIGRRCRDQRSYGCYHSAIQYA